MALHDQHIVASLLRQGRTPSDCILYAIIVTDTGGRVQS
jgi:hypothetical protein